MRVAAGGEQQNKVILSGCFPLGGFGGDFHPRMPNKFLMMVGRELFLYMEGLPAKCFCQPSVQIIADFGVSGFGLWMCFAVAGLRA